MIPGENRSKIPPEMTAAHYSNYLNEVFQHLKLTHLVKTHYILHTGFCCVMLWHHFNSHTFPLSLVNQNTNLCLYFVLLPSGPQ